jgi:methyl-accepting chemotaxis protein
MGDRSKYFYVIFMSFVCFFSYDVNELILKNSNFFIYPPFRRILMSSFIGSFFNKVVLFLGVLFVLLLLGLVMGNMGQADTFFSVGNLFVIGSMLWLIAGGLYLLLTFKKSIKLLKAALGNEKIQTDHLNQSEFLEILSLFKFFQEASEEKAHWYTSVLDAIPFPLSVTDMEMNWTFINRPVEQFLKVKREDVVGHQCSEWNANICNTENCGIARLRKNFLTTFFDQMGGHFRVDTTYLYNTAGEKIGHVEAVQDISALVASQRYQAAAVDQLSIYLENLANGKLGFTVEALPPADENTKEVRKNFETITLHLVQAQRMLSEAIGSVLHNANQVSEASKQLALAAAQSGQATSQISTTMQQVARGTSQQSESIGQTAQIMQQVSSVVSGVAKGVKDQKTAINEVRDISSLISSENGITARVNQSAHKVQELGVRSEKIGEIVSTIEDIASQTNLLALNAAIEAARAGEHGKGFAVVADEVRKLAEGASNASKEISELIKGIQVMVGEAVEISTTVSVDVSGVSENLNQAILGVLKVADQNDNAAVSLGDGTNGVMDAIENIASVSEENSASVEEVSASAEEMSAQVEEVTAAAQSLEEMANALQRAITQFQLN